MVHHTLRHRLLLVLVTLLVLLPLAAGRRTAQAAHPADQSVTLNFWVFEGENQILPAFVKAFHDQHPNINVHITLIPEDNYVTKIDTALAAGSPPDIGWIYDPHWLKAGKLLPMDSVIAAHHITVKDFSKGVVHDECTYNGRLYCLGSYLDGEVLWYNKDMFRAAHIPFPSTTKPLTIDQYAAIAKKLSKPNQDIKKRVWGGFAEDPFWYQDFRNFVDPTGHKVTGYLNSPRTVRMFAALAGMVHDGAAPSSAAGQLLSNVNIFASGQQAMTVDSAEEFNFADAKHLHYGVAPVPVPAGEKPWVSTWTDAWGVFSGSKHPKEAEEFLAFIWTQGQDIRVKVTGQLPLDYTVADRLHWAGTNAAKAQFLQVLKLARPNVFAPNLFSILGALDDPFNLIANGKESAQKALDDVTPRIQQNLDQAWQTWNEIQQ